MKKNVGIIEKDKTIRGLLEQLTREKGHVPVALAPGEEILSRVSAQNFSLLFIAPSAQGVHTLDLCRDIHNAMPDCKIVIITSSSLEWSDLEMKEGGIVRVLEKPLSRKKIIALFNEHLGLSGTPSHQQMSLPNGIERVPGYRERILVVDDDRAIVATMKDVLDRHGFRVSTAGDGVKAMEMVKKENFDIIITDIHMPRMGGLETIQKIKQFSPSSFIVMMTGEGTESEIKEGLTEGGYACIHKPFSIKKLLGSIEWYSHAAHQARQSREKKKRLEQRSAVTRWRGALKKKWRDWSRTRRMAIVSGALVFFTIFLSIFLTLFLQYMGTTLTEQVAKYDNLTLEMIKTLKKSQMHNFGAGQMQFPMEREDSRRGGARPPGSVEE